MGSSRLPGKVMSDLAGRPALAWVLRAARAALGIDEAWVATTTSPADDVIESWCGENGVPFHRGSETDVVGRYAEAARRCGAGIVVRITADCPFLDPTVVAQTVRLRSVTGADYCSNVNPPTWPDGLDCEVMTAAALNFAAAEASSPYEREHVTPFVRSNPQRFPACNLVAPLPGLAEERWTLDTPEDYAFLSAVAKQLPAERPPSFLEVLAVLDREPQLRDLNRHLRARPGQAASAAANSAARSCGSGRKAGMSRSLPVPPAAARCPLMTIDTDRHVLDAVLADAAFAEIEVDPHSGAFGRSYHAAVNGDRDVSFFVRAGGLPALVGLCAPLDGLLGFYILPLRIFTRPGLEPAIERAAVRAAFSHLDALAKKLGLREAVVQEPAAPQISAIGEACLARGANATPLHHACVDLTAGHAAWRAAVRKSSRSLINWGRRNLTVRIVNREKPDRGPFDEYQLFHAQVAGRITRPQASWDVMYDFVAGGAGELVLADLDGRLVAGSLFIDGSEICIYASGVYDRAMFDKPLSHYPVWLAIERAHTRGMKTLELGVVHNKGTVSDKEYQIGYFKRGFATHIEEFTVWRWLPSSR
jgi:spore coat polysaccharide biosynthesis protein SpsF (cytidylyltransferase family)